MNAKVSRLVRERDPHCWHCSTSSGLVLHHRANRGMGGSKILDTPQNMIMVCRVYNDQMESQADVAAAARDNGHKLGRYASPTMPVYDAYFKKWFILDTKGGKFESEPPAFLL